MSVASCRWCGTATTRELIEQHELDCSYNPGCLLCEAQTDLQEHHISYYPEETVFVCVSCHSKIHTTDGFHDELVPNRPRPENYGRGDFHARNARRS